MTSLIAPLVQRELSELRADLAGPVAPDMASTERRLARLRDQVALFRCPQALDILEHHLALIALSEPGLVARVRPDRRLRARIAAGWPGLASGAARAVLAAVEGAADDPALLARTLDDAGAALGLDLRALAAPAPAPAPQTAPAASDFAPMDPVFAPVFLGDPAGPLAPITPGGLPGVSLVSCCMNRNDNLMRSLKSWLAVDEIAEIVIVDWSSDRPVARELMDAGITDRRIRVMRVEGEPRWVLSYAFNVGFRAATFDTILKADADIMLTPDFFQRNPRQPGTLIAGNWRDAAPDQHHVNGFFVVERAALARVGGFNEHITTYGWDDDDLYARLVLSGCQKVNVTGGTIYHLPHSDVLRTGDDAAGAGAGQAGPGLRPTARDATARDTQFLIRRNRFIAAAMPDWDGNALLLPFDILWRGPGGMVLRREGWVPSAVPQNMIEAANGHAWRELLSWRLGRDVLALDRPALEVVLERPNADVSAVDIEIARRDPGKVMRGEGRYLLVEIADAVLDDLAQAPGAWPALEALVARARAFGLGAVFRLERAGLPPGAPAGLRDLPVLPVWQAVGALANVHEDELLDGDMVRQHDLRLPLTAEGLARLAVPAPAIGQRRARLYIDTQHGLGNRLRAMASAAAIARGCDRDLVVIWEKDAHCDCRLGDLFAYDGAVEETRFIDAARARRFEVLNYMAQEPGAEKDAAVPLDSGRDIYARSAFVLNAPYSTWEAECALLQRLTPVEAVRALVAQVRHPNDIAVHVRMQGGAGHEHLPHERPDNWLPADHAAIQDWRARSHYANFLGRIDQLMAKGASQTLFLAADLPETYEFMTARYGERLAWLPRKLFDRSAAQLQYGLADAILLGRAPRLLGSTWSSFTELASRLAPGPQIVEMSGTDF